MKKTAIFFITPTPLARILQYPIAKFIDKVAPRKKLKNFSAFFAVWHEPCSM